MKELFDRASPNVLTVRHLVDKSTTMRKRSHHRLVEALLVDLMPSLFPHLGTQFRPQSYCRIFALDYRRHHTLFCPIGRHFRPL